MKMELNAQKNINSNAENTDSNLYRLAEKILKNYNHLF